MKTFKKALLALPLIGMLFSCSNGDDILPGPDPKPEPTYWNSTYVNGTFPLGTSNEYKGEIADPSIVKGDDGYLYIVSTLGKMFRSEDGCQWTLVKEKLIGRPTWGDEYCKPGAGPQIWAPDLVKIGDQWIFYYSLSAWGEPVGIGYAVSDTIDGKYTDKGKLFTCDEVGINNCIDPCIYQEDGHVYMGVGSFCGIYLVELDASGTQLLNGSNYQKQNKVLIAGNDDGVFHIEKYEGSYIMKKDDTYYLFGSSGSCCEGKSSTYRVVVGKSDSLFGPYVDSKGVSMVNKTSSTIGEMVVWAGSMEDRPYIGPGHNSIYVDDAGDWRIYYHSYIETDKFATRHLMMDKLLWTDDGFPYVDTKKPSFDVELDGPRFLDE